MFWFIVILLLILGSCCVGYLLSTLISSTKVFAPKEIRRSRGQYMGIDYAPYFEVVVTEQDKKYSVVMYMALTRFGEPLPYIVHSEVFESSWYATDMASNWVASIFLGDEWIEKAVYTNRSLRNYVEPDLFILSKLGQEIGARQVAVGQPK